MPVAWIQEKKANLRDTSYYSRLFPKNLNRLFTQQSLCQAQNHLSPNVWEVRLPALSLGMEDLLCLRFYFKPSYIRLMQFWVSVFLPRCVLDSLGRAWGVRAHGKQHMYAETQLQAFIVS